MSNYTNRSPILNTNVALGKVRQGGWKTIEGWNYQSKKLAYCLVANERLQCKRYSWHCTINIKSIVEPHSLWKSASKILRQHLTAFYIREPNNDGHVNYHLLINSDVSKERLKDVIQSAFRRVEFTSTIACKEAFERSFSELALGKDPPPYDERCPFRGLYPFRREDREFFFGREALIARLQERLTQANFLAVLGPSGSASTGTRSSAT
jgi:hypothetical protein